MEDKKECVFGIYKTRGELENGVEALRRVGFLTSDISVLLPSGPNDLAHTKSSKAPEAAMAGGGSGIVIGGTLGLLVGIGALAIPGVGPLIAAGPIMAALAGAGAGGALGGITGGLIGLGMPEYEAKRYSGQVKEGGLLVSVHTATRESIKEAKEILERTGARDISASSEVTGKGVERNSTVRPEPTLRNF